MKKIQNSKQQKLKLSRETLRHLQARQLERIRGGEGATTEVSCPLTNCYPCRPSLEAAECTTD